MKARFVFETVDFERGGTEKDIRRRIVGDRPGKIMKPGWSRKTFEVYILTKDGDYIETGFFMKSPGSHKYGGGLKTFYLAKGNPERYSFEREELAPLSNWEQNKMREFFPKIAKWYGVDPYFGGKVNEDVDFERGQDPRKALGIGPEVLIKKYLEDLYGNFSPPEYRINSDFSIDIEEVDIPDFEILEFPKYINFNYCSGDFMVDYCKLHSLRGCPKKVRGYFSCEGNDLHSLDGAPEIVQGDFFCRDNPGQFTKADVEKVCKVGGKIYAQDNLYDE